MPRRFTRSPYRCETESGWRCADPSGARENTNASSRSSTPSAATRCSHRRRCSARTASVSGSRGHAPLLVVLGVLLPQPLAALPDAPTHREYPGREVEMFPSESAQLTAPRAGNHGEPHERAVSVERADLHRADEGGGCAYSRTPCRSTASSAPASRARNPVQHLVDRRGRPRVAPFVDLAGEAGIRHQGPPTIMIRTINPRAA